MSAPDPSSESLACRLDYEEWLRRGLIILVCAGLFLAVVLPLWQLLLKSFQDQAGNPVGLTNYIRYLHDPALAGSLGNSLRVAALTTAISVFFGFLFAYALTRTAIPCKEAFMALAMAPLFAPTLLNGIALVYLFGKKGLVTTGFFGLVPGIDINLYGPTGIVLGEIIYTFPQAALILATALRMTDARLYEASDSLGASRAKTFFTVTLPGAKYGLVSAVFVCFILCFTDFGVPKVVGGNYNVLATDIYKQVIGQQNFSMGAVVGMVLLLPTVLAFVADRLIQRRQVALVTARFTPLVPKPAKVRDRLFFTYCLLVSLAILGFFGVATFASLVKVWPYDLSFGLWHYQFRGTGGGGAQALYNSLRMALYSALFGSALAFAGAYLTEKGRGLKSLRQAAHFLSILPLALPGLVIGLSYIFFFNAPGWTLFGLRLTNPFHFLYGTMGILVLSNIVHFYSVSYLTSTTALKQLDKEFETVSASLGVPFHRTFFRVTVPVCLPALLESFMYYFVNAMATVSAVIFLYSADLPLASTAVANMDDAGDTAPACAMSMCIVLANTVARLLHALLTRGARRGAQAWTAR